MLKNQELLVLITAAMPISELRGAIPLGVVTFKMSLFKVLTLAILGNLAPIVPVLFFLEPVSNKLRSFRIFKKFFDWLFERTKKKARLVEKYEFLGLMLFVAVPLPMTGAWTGAVAASLFKLRFRYGFSAIALGVIIAAGLVAFFTVYGIKPLFNS